MGRALALLLPGMILAASMRPMFWVVAGCWGIVCVWGLIKGPRKFYAICLGCMAAVMILFICARKISFFKP